MNTVGCVIGCKTLQEDYGDDFSELALKYVQDELMGIWEVGEDAVDFVTNDFEEYVMHDPHLGEMYSDEMYNCLSTEGDDELQEYIGNLTITLQNSVEDVYDLESYRHIRGYISDNRDTIKDLTFRAGINTLSVIMKLDK